METAAPILAFIILFGCLIILIGLVAIVLLETVGDRFPRRIFCSHRDKKCLTTEYGSRVAYCPACLRILSVSTMLDSKEKS